MADALQIDTSKLMTRTVQLVAIAKKDLGEEMRVQFRGVMKEVVNRTAPSSNRVRGSAAKQRGQARIRGDIFNAIIPVEGKGAVDSTDVKGVIRPLRNKRGRIPKQPRKIRVPKQAANAYLKSKLARVGYLAAGWNRGAAKVGYRPPAWVWKQSSPSAVEIEISDKRIRFKATNRVKYAGQVRFLESRIQRAVNEQEKKAFRQVTYLTQKAAKKAGLGK